MTDVLERPMTAAAPAISQGSNSDVLDWSYTDVVAPAVWIGRYNGAYVGMIEERTGEGFVSMTRLGRSLGRFDDLDAAKAAFLKR